MPINLSPLPAFILTSCLFATGVHSAKPNVQQTPRSMSLTEGHSVTMNCIINIAGPKVYTWLKNDLEARQAISAYTKRVTEEKGTSKDPNVILTSLEIRNVTECDSGTYYCRVNNVGQITKGAGTTLTVTRVTQKVKCSINYVLIGVSAGVIGLLCISLIIVLLRLQQRNKACIALQRQFVAYITEKSTESLPLKPKGHHKRREGSASSSGQEGKKKKKRKVKELPTMACPDYVHDSRPQGARP
ncbi:tyrosine-protein phosphatase non-receptor type substrate 1-like [Mustelus asterias]